MNTSDDRDSVERRYGKGMFFLFWVFVLMLGYLFFDDKYQDFFNPNREPLSELTEHGTAEVTLLRNRYGHYVTKGEINREAVVFMLDTGASSVSIPQKVARKLRLQKGMPYPVRTANGTVNVYRTKLAEVSIGDIRLYDVEGHINPYMHSGEILLGMSFLKQLDFNQSGDRLTLIMPTAESDSSNRSSDRNSHQPSHQ